jgi:hypothetical protein
MKANSACVCLVAIAIPLFATPAVSGGVQGFFFAETLKYFYLLLGSPHTINLKNNSAQTEAHSLRRNWQPSNGWQVHCGRLV